MNMEELKKHAAAGKSIADVMAEMTVELAAEPGLGPEAAMLLSYKRDAVQLVTRAMNGGNGAHLSACAHAIEAALALLASLGKNPDRLVDAVAAEAKKGAATLAPRFQALKAIGVPLHIPLREVLL